MLMTAAEFDNKMGNTDVNSAFLRLCVVAQEYAGNPTNNVVPNRIHSYCHDTTNGDLYWASTAASSGWKKLNN